MNKKTIIIKFFLSLFSLFLSFLSHFFTKKRERKERKNIFNIYCKTENGFVSFFALMALIATAFIGSGLMLLTNENAKTARHHEIAVQLRYDAESAVEKIAYDIENKKIILPEDIKYIDEYVIASENLSNFEGNNKTVKASIKYEDKGIRIFAVAEKTDEKYTTLGLAEGFMEENEDSYKWKYWIKLK